jgi:hypothetical protein
VCKQHLDLLARLARSVRLHEHRAPVRAVLRNGILEVLINRKALTVRRTEGTPAHQTGGWEISDIKSPNGDDGVREGLWRHRCFVGSINWRWNHRSYAGDTEIGGPSVAPAPKSHERYGLTRSGDRLACRRRSDRLRETPPRCCGSAQRDALHPRPLQQVAPPHLFEVAAGNGKYLCVDSAAAVIPSKSMAEMRGPAEAGPCLR